MGEEKLGGYVRGFSRLMEMNDRVYLIITGNSYTYIVFIQEYEHG